NQEKFEITTARRDIKCYGRYADVEFTNNFQEDAERRDFTINALSYSIYEDKIYDYFNGIEHLKQGQVIFIGDPGQRIVEDYWRILRFFRFSARFAKDIDQQGLEACIYYKERLQELSVER